MIHMLSAFDLGDDEVMSDFQVAYAAFVADLENAGLIAFASPLGARHADSPMDTDDTRAHTLFSILSFRDRAQLDAAYAHIEARAHPGTASHGDMYARVRNAVFTCWEDIAQAG